MFVARDKDGELTLFPAKPVRACGDSWWDDQTERFFLLEPWLFPDLTWEDEPIEVELIKKERG